MSVFEQESAALNKFAHSIGVEPSAVAGWEDVGQIYFEDDGLYASTAAGLELEQLREFAQAFAGALTCQFSLRPKERRPDEKDLILNLTQRTDAPDIARFQDQIEDCEALSFYFRIDKACLLETHEIQAARCAFYLYLFPSAFHCFLKGETSGGAPCNAQQCLSALEEKLWPKKLARKAVILVEGQDVYLDGSYLAVLGGRFLDHWRDAVPVEAPDFDSLSRHYRKRLESVTWDEPWITHLTPPHLKVDVAREAGEPVLSALQIHLLNLVILFTANRAAGEVDDWCVTYADESYTKEMRLLAPAQKRNWQGLEQSNSVYEVFTWAYFSEWPRDRLTIAQGAIAQELVRHSDTDAYHVLLRQSGAILSTVDRRWRQFTQQKIKAYTDEELKLEEFVVKTVDAFAERVSAMVNAVSETMLAAIAALFGSFIAAGFGSQEFNVFIFSLGMLAYSLYVLAFPLLYSMSIQWTHYRAIYIGMQAGLERFAEGLGDVKAVQNIVGERLEQSNRRFRLWFVITIGIYLVAIALGFLTAAIAPLLFSLLSKP